MDKTVPKGAAILLDFIRKTEVGTEARSGYDVIYAHKQGLLPKPITKMTIAELQGHQAKGWPAKSTASGGNVDHELTPPPGSLSVAEVGRVRLGALCR